MQLARGQAGTWIQVSACSRDPSCLYRTRLFCSSPFMTPLTPSSGSVVKNLPTSAGDTRDVGLIPGMGRPPGEGNGNPLQCSCLGKFYRQRSLVGYSPWGCNESNMPGHAPTTTTTPSAHVNARIGRSNLLGNRLMYPEGSFPEAGDQFALTVAPWQGVTELCVHLYFSLPPRGTVLLPSFSLCLWS